MSVISGSWSSWHQPLWIHWTSLPGVGHILGPGLRPQQAAEDKSEVQDGCHLKKPICETAAFQGKTQQRSSWWVWTGLEYGHTSTRATTSVS